MTADELLRFAALAVFAAAFVISALFRARAERKGRSLVRRGDRGRPSALFRVLAGLVIWGTLLISLAVPAQVPWLIGRLPLGLRWVGLAMAIGSVPLLWWTLRALGTNVSPSTATREGATLVTTGPYRYVRHPLYSVGTQLLLGLSLAIQSLGLLGVVGLALLWLPHRAREEEDHLVGSFGDRYRRYQEATGRFLPRLG